VLAGGDGGAAGAGAVIAAACDLRIASVDAKFGFIFPRVGLSGADMGASYLLPRLVGLAHASEILFFGDVFDAATALRIGFVNRVVDDGHAARELGQEWAARIADGPGFAHAMTKQMLESEARMTLSDAIEAEAQAQALCMQHPDFAEAHAAFKAKRAPRFVGAPGPSGDGA
jgi:enoyl-CoA hydratase/carnithine racemase